MIVWDMQLMSTVYRKHVIPLPLSLTSLFGTFCFFLFWHFLLFFFFSRDIPLFDCTLFITNSTFIHLFIPISFSFLFHFFFIFIPTSTLGWRVCALIFLCNSFYSNLQGWWCLKFVVNPTTYFPMSFGHTQKGWFWKVSRIAHAIYLE